MDEPDDAAKREVERLRHGLNELARELEQRVAQRTAELAAANADLQLQIAERTKAEEALRESEQSARSIVDGIPGLVALMTPAGEIEFVNRQVVEYTGRVADELKAWATDGTVHPEDAGRVGELLGHAFASGIPYDVEERIRRFDGTYRWFQVRGLPSRHASGHIVRWCVLLTDIDERMRAEEALRRSQAFLAQGQHLARMGNFSWRTGSGEITWSDQLYRIFELEVGTSVTLELVASKLHPEDVAGWRELIERASRALGTYEHECRLLMSDDSVKYMHLIAHGVRDEQGRSEYIGTLQDVTQRRASEEALGRARSELAHAARVMSLGVLTASIVHEVSQPLSAILTNSNTSQRMLAADPPNVTGAREIVRRITRDGVRGSEVLARLRSLFGKKERVIETVDLNEATREVVALSASRLQQARVSVRLELAEDLPAVTGDRVQLQQVILNLIGNAHDAMSAVEHRPRELRIRTARVADDSIELAVQDSGVGFDPQVADTLFEAFWTTKTQGMGIGLSVSRTIVEDHRGRLWATANDGPGVTFRFSIPSGAPDSARCVTPRLGFLA